MIKTKLAFYPCIMNNVGLIATPNYYLNIHHVTISALQKCCSSQFLIKHRESLNPQFSADLVSMRVPLGHDC